MGTHGESVEFRRESVEVRRKGVVVEVVQSVSKKIVNSVEFPPRHENSTAQKDPLTTSPCPFQVVTKMLYVIENVLKNLYFHIFFVFWPQYIFF